ncbi:ligand-effect modulator 3 family [Fimicolochytrium jonesii]|uniref:ligand-effect modulator 3 family n=1 Tax=Fimicolochytrium jonesii TaxID=1396493 RepID=UPI0022FF3FAC|nr:ligand-effect modulator 3 family [Fimicolochytrium jonesii]KAI8820272.1 ligand-effect modulator 3 family [Fimicolochytrium jonesii]
MGVGRVRGRAKDGRRGWGRRRRHRGGRKKVCMGAAKPWKQQNLPYYFPILTPALVTTPLLLVAALFIPLGAYLHHANTSLSEIGFDYTECSTLASTTYAPPPPHVSSNVQAWKYDPATSTCTLQLAVGWTLPAPVFMYIALTNFYQNHRLYVKSLSHDQLKGKAFMKAGDITGICSWLQYANCDKARQVGTWQGVGNMADMNPDCRKGEGERDAVVKNAVTDAQYYPCGLIANSVFSDDIGALSPTGSAPTTTTPYTFATTDIAWPEDRESYALSTWFTDPSLASQIPTTLIPPPQWRWKYPQGYNATNHPDLSTDQRLMVWMRKAGFPSFRKLWGKNADADLVKGVYELAIVDRFDVRRFEGTKGVYFSTLGPLGSRESFVGIMLLAVGALAGFLAFVVWVVRVRKLGDRSYLSWNADKPPALRN